MDIFPVIPKLPKANDLFNQFSQPDFFDSMAAAKKAPKPVQPPHMNSADQSYMKVPKSPQSTSTTLFGSTSTSIIPVDPVKKQSLEDMHSQWAKGKKSEDLQKIIDELASDIDKAVYAYSGLNSGPAVKSKAKVLATKAVKRYDPKSGTSLKSWVYTQLQPLSRYSRDLSPSPMPERAYQQLSAIKRHEVEFYENKGRPPSDAELADLTSMSVKQIQKIKEMEKKTYNESYAAYSGDTPATSQEITAIENTNFKKNVLDTLYSSLTPQEQLILEHKLGYNDKRILSNNDLAKKLGISPGRVSQLTTQLSKKLEEYAELNKGNM
jgi:RNA polymerase sigma factor (sigma-70 family)